MRHTSIILARITCLGVALLMAARAGAQVAWTPGQGPLKTQWAAQVSPEQALPDYPRPQMSRGEWQNLNGLWDYAIRPRGENQPATFDGKILVPFAAESALSGVMKPVGQANRLWYRRTFELPAAWQSRRTLLHFGAVDFGATVSVNGKPIGTHQGGYVPFSFDISDALKSSGPQEIVLAVWDPTDAGHQPRGKQVNRPNGIWYTAVTGIWQTVWIEPVAATSIAALHAVPDIDSGLLTLNVALRGNQENISIEAIALDGGAQVATAAANAGQPIKLNIANAKLWSPDDPHLYDLKVAIKQNGRALDEVASYIGMRKIALAKDEKGVLRLALNNKPLFQFGLLDQGWWPDGLYTAPTDEALKYDIELTKKYGFNMARKHVKVEPARWYYWCDRLGLLVWQDMPSGFARGERGQYRRPEDSAKQWERELKEMIDALRNHPSIMMWVPFNEGWGQYDTPRITNWVKQYDPTRLVNNASGWTDMKVGDVNDMHNYPGPNSPPLEESRAVVQGEFGGLGLPVAGHTWREQANWGYRNFTNLEETTRAYLDLIDKLHVLVGSPGLAAAVYTQTTDVESEVNGLLNYDRTIKLSPERIAGANRKVYSETPPPPPIILPLLAASREQSAEWQYTTVKPGENWFAPNFAAADWQHGPAGFGTRQTPNTVVRTEWSTNDIWLRRTFELPASATFVNPHLTIHHDEDCEVYINGTLAAEVKGYNSGFELVRIAAEAAKLIKPGENTIAVHVRQTTGGQYIDVGIVDVVPAVNFLMLPPPHMPTSASEPPLARRTREEVATVLAGAPKTSASPKPLRLLLVAGRKDHGRGEHDYPTWLRVWSKLLSAGDGVTVDTAMRWPTVEQLRVADTLMIYQKGEWNAERAAAIDAHLAKGGGLVLIHWAIEGGNGAAAFADRIGIAADQTRTKFRHGPLEIDWGLGSDNPIARNFSKLSLNDESYWDLMGDPSTVNVLAAGGPEDGDAKPPLFWTVERKQGRVFVSIPGHYSSTFDDPLYRTILLRGVAWASHEPVDRFNALIPLGVEFATTASNSGE